MSAPRGAAAALLLFCVGAAADARNVLILLADDGGFELGAYRNKICQTPNIDALARRGVVFNNAFTSVSSCSPSRAALLTGEPAHRNGMYGLHHGVHHFDSFRNVSSLPNELRARGLHTGIIGKKHVGPPEAYRFHYEQTEENNRIDQVGRNITLIKLLTREFLAEANRLNKSFFLYVGFHDPHRCGREAELYGPFCERFGSGEPGTGRIPDWRPWYYDWQQVQLPYHVQDTEAARRDIAAQYTTISRLDQGVGLVLAELAAAGRAADTLVLYTSDNGVPFPSGRTNLYEPGMRVPLLLAPPGPPRAAPRPPVGALVSSLDIKPTVLDWLGFAEPAAAAGSLLRFAGVAGAGAGAADADVVFASHTLHEVTMYYPVRAVRSRRYKLLHNLNYRMPYPIDQDLYRSPTFQDILNRTRLGRPLPWYKTLQQHYLRPQWELYDLRRDPLELHNLHGKPALKAEEEALRAQLRRWQRDTRDPWRCSPGAVLLGDECRALLNGLGRDEL